MKSNLETLAAGIFTAALTFGLAMLYVWRTGGF